MTNQMPLQSRSILSTNNMARRKRSRSPAISRHAEEPNRKLARLRNMDIGEDGTDGFSCADCADLPYSPDFRQNGLFTEAKHDPQTQHQQINGVLKKKAKDIRKGKGRTLLRNNFQLLKQEMEPIQVVDYLKECGAVDHALHRKIVDGKWRSERVDTLMKGLLRLMNDENEDKIFALIIDALDKSRQTELSLELQKEPNSFHTGETELRDENKRLLQFFKKTKEKLKEVLEPRKILEEIFDLQGLNLDTYEEIKNEPRKEISVDILFMTLESRHGKEWQILRPVYNWYQRNTSECESNDKAETTSSFSHESTELKVCYQPVIAQDASEHTDPYSKLRELQQSVVHNINENGDQSGDLEQSLIDQCAAKLKQISFSSINLHLHPLTDKSLQKLIECCKGEKVKQWILSILSEDDLKALKELKATTVTVKVFVKDLQRDNKYILFDEVAEGCFCMVSKDWVRHNRDLFKDVVEGLETKVINSLLKHNTLSEDMKGVLQTRRSSEQLVDFLCNQSLPEVSYCFIENDVLKNDRRDFISELREESSTITDCVRVRHISNIEIKEHKKLLEEELDANWFVSSLKACGDKASEDMVEIIEHSSSRRDRTRQFVEFLCKVDDKDFHWFAEILHQNHKHIFQILLPEILTNVSEIRHGLLSVFDYLTEELAPEEFSRSLKASSYEKLECAQLQHLRNKRERSVRFLSHLLKKENSYLVPEVVNAMKTYNGDIYSTLQQVLEKGSLDEHYRCPIIEKERLKSSKCCFKTTISLTEDDQKELIQEESLLPHKAINQDSTSDKSTKHIKIKPTEVPYEPSKYNCQYSSSERKSNISCSDPYSRKYLKGNSFENIATATDEQSVRMGGMLPPMPLNTTETMYTWSPVNAGTKVRLEIPQASNYGPSRPDPCSTRQIIGSVRKYSDRYQYNPLTYKQPQPSMNQLYEVLFQELEQDDTGLDRHEYIQKLQTSDRNNIFDNKRERQSSDCMSWTSNSTDEFDETPEIYTKNSFKESMFGFDLHETIQKLQTSDRNKIFDDQPRPRQASDGMSCTSISADELDETPKMYEKSSFKESMLGFDLHETIQKLQKSDRNKIFDDQPRPRQASDGMSCTSISADELDETPKMYEKSSFKESMLGFDLHDPIQKLQTSDRNYVSGEISSDYNMSDTEELDEIPEIYKKNSFRESCNEFLHKPYKADGESSSTSIEHLRPRWNPSSRIRPPRLERCLFGPLTSLQALRHDFNADLSKPKEEFRQNWNFSRENPIPNFIDYPSAFRHQPGGVVESEHMHRKRYPPSASRKLYERNQSYKDRNASILKHSELETTTLCPSAGIGYSSKATKGKYQKLPKMETQPEDQLETNAVFQTAAT